MRCVPAGTHLLSADDTLPPAHETTRKKFHSGVHKALLLATRVRLGVLCSSTFLSRRVQVATSQDWTKLVCVLKYLSYSRLCGLSLGGDESGATQLEACADADHAGLLVTLGRGST